MPGQFYSSMKESNMYLVVYQRVTSCFGRRPYTGFRWSACCSRLVLSWLGSSSAWPPGCQRAPSAAAASPPQTKPEYESSRSGLIRFNPKQVSEWTGWLMLRWRFLFFPVKKYSDRSTYGAHLCLRLVRSASLVKIPQPLLLEEQKQWETFFIIYRHIWHKCESSEFTPVVINICLNMKEFGGLVVLSP